MLRGWTIGSLAKNNLKRRVSGKLFLPQALSYELICCIYGNQLIDFDLIAIISHHRGNQLNWSSIMKIWKLCAIGLASLIAACGASIQPYRISDAQTVKVIEGTVVFVDLKRVPIKQSPEFTTKDTIITGTSAQNIGNHGVQKSLLFLDVIDDVTAQKFRNQFEMRVLNKSNGAEETIIMQNANGNLKNFEVGDVVRVIYRSDTDRFIANLTKSQKLDALTR